MVVQNKSSSSLSFYCATEAPLNCLNQSTIRQSLTCIAVITVLCVLLKKFEKALLLIKVALLADMLHMAICGFLALKSS